MIFLIFIFVAIVLFIMLKKAHENTKKVNIKHVQIPLKEDHKEKIKILHLSDLHLEHLSIQSTDLYHMVQKKTPLDLIIITGDFMDRKRSIPKILPYLEVLKKLNPACGIFAVFGNHDYVLKGENFNKLKKTLEENGCKTLQNEHRTLAVKGKIVNIIGIDDYSTNRSDLEKSFQGLSDGFNLVITHDPNIVLEMKGFQFDYLLSGHFHGGQICWPKPYHLVKMGKLARKKIIKGLHYYDGKPFYINEGLGQTGVNIRVISRPEITFHEIG